MARYKLVRTPNPKNDGKIMPYHARNVAYGTVGLNEMCDRIADSSSFSSGVVKGVIQMIQDVIVNELRFGNNVELDGIGTFSLSLKCPPVMNKKEIRAESIDFKTVNFRPSSQLCGRLKALPLYKEPEEKGKESYSPEERRERMLDYFKKRERLTGNSYIWLNHCSRSCACRDLSRFCKEGLIKSYGRGPTIYYVKSDKR